MGGDNIIVRYISSRPGEKGSGDYDAWGGSNGSNSIIDHCSIGWANDEQFGLYSNNMNQTVQYTITGLLTVYHIIPRALMDLGLCLERVKIPGIIT